jgi:hypothetical protein
MFSPIHALLDRLRRLAAFGAAPVTEGAAAADVAAPLHSRELFAPRADELGDLPPFESRFLRFSGTGSHGFRGTFTELQT